MFNRNTTALYAVVITAVLVASVFAISFVQQQAVAQGNMTGGAAGGNMTGGAAGGNTTCGGA